VASLSTLVCVITVRRLPVAPTVGPVNSGHRLFEFAASLLALLLAERRPVRLRRSCQVDSFWVSA
jgi:hypothetical protein